MALMRQPGGGHVGDVIDVDDGDGGGARASMVTGDRGHDGGCGRVQRVAEAMTNLVLYMRRPKVNGDDQR